MRRLGVILLLVFMVFACKSVEDQEKAWASLKAKVDGYVKKYPAIEMELTQQLKSAEASYLAALEEGDKDTKIDKMGDAISMLRTAPFKTVIDLENKIKNTESKIVEIKDEFTTEEFGSKTLFLIEQSTPVIAASKEALIADYSSGREALIAFNSALITLKNVYRDLDEHYDEIMDIRKETEEAQNAAIAAEQQVEQDSKAPSTPVEKKAVKTIKCKKCGGISSLDKTRCEKCGAPL